MAKALRSFLLVTCVLAIALATAATTSAKSTKSDAGWVRQFGTSADDWVLGMASDSSGNTYVVGYTYGQFPLQVQAGGVDVFVTKYDASGNLAWVRQFGSPFDDSACGVAVNSTGIYVVGDTYGSIGGQVSSGSDDAFIAKLDAAGNIVWVRQLGTGTLDWSSGVSLDDSGIYVLGGTLGALPGQAPSGGDDSFIAKYDFSGNMVWTRQFGTNTLDQAYGVSATSSGVYVAGSTYGIFPGQVSAGNLDAFVTKFDGSGNLIWVRQFGTAFEDGVYSISAGASGLYLTGYSGGTLPGQTSSGDMDAFAVNCDFSGNLVWTRQFGTETFDSGTGVSADVGGIYVAGVTWGTFPNQRYTESDDSFVVKYDSSGNVAWLEQFGTDANDYVYGVSANSTGIYMAGQTMGVFSGQSSAGGADGFVVKFSQSVSRVPPGWNEGKKLGWNGSSPSGLSKEGEAPDGFDHGGKTGWDKQVSSNQR